MSTSTTRRLLVATAGALVLTGLAAGPSNARPDAGPAVATASVPSDYECLLTRVGQQFTRCDNLTGNGVPAPTWIRER